MTKPIIETAHPDALIEIKPAAREELYEIAAFLHDSWKAEYRGLIRDDFLDTMTIEDRYQGLQSWFDEGIKSYLTMRYGGKLIGAAVFGKSYTEGYPNDGEISAIYLHSEYIGKGYGHQLFTKIEDALAEKGYTYFVLDVLSDNTRAVAFYKKYGYGVANDKQTVKLGDIHYPLTVFRKKNPAMDGCVL